MAHRNEESDREQSTYGRSGSLRDRQQAGGPQQPWRETSGQQHHNQGFGQFQQHDGGPQQYESGQYRPQGYGARERQQDWENERGPDFQARGQGYAQGDQYGQGRQGYGPGSQYGPAGQGYGQGSRYGQGSHGYGQDNEYGLGGQRSVPVQGNQYGYGEGRDQDFGQDLGPQRQEFGYGQRGGGIYGSGYGGGLGRPMGYGSNLTGDQDFPGTRGFRGIGPKNYTRPDDRIRDDVCERLTLDDDLDASDIEIKAEQGKVILEGTVDERWMKHRAEDLAESCSGVRDVENRIRVEARSRLGGTESLGRSSENRGTQAGGASGKH